MARDADLLVGAELGRVGVRVYRWSEATVSLGMFQRPDRDLLVPNRIPWVMRPTGGKAVLHGHDETVGLAVPLERLGVGSRSVRDAYRAVIRPLLSALRSCGLDAQLGEQTRFVSRGAPRTTDCFAHVAPNDVVDPTTGLKICGCALRLTERAVLVQASIPNGPPLVDPQTLFAQPATAAWPKWNGALLSEALQESLLAERWFST